MTRPHLRRPRWTRSVVTRAPASPAEEAAEPTGATTLVPVRKRRRLWVIIGGLSVLVVLLGAAAWVGWRAWQAKGELEQAQSLVSDLKDKVSASDYAGATDVFGEIRVHAATARGLTEDPLWSTAQHVPVLGPNLTALRGLSVVIDDAITAADPLVRIAADLTPAALKPQNGVLPIAPVVQAASDITAVADRFTALRTQLAAVPTDGAVVQLRDAKTKLAGVIDGAATALTGAAPVVRALPAVLGADGPRRYVVMFLNTAELRSLGGTALAFAEITVDHGAITLGDVVPTSGGSFSNHASPVIPVPDGFDDIYPGSLGRFVANATLRPSAVTAAEIVQAEWKSTFGTDVDGVISMDAKALALLVEAVGPITISTGDVVSAGNVVSLLFNEVYTRYDTGVRAVDDALQGKVYSETVGGTFAKLMSGDFEPKVLLESLQAAAATRGLNVWLADPAAREAFSTTGFLAQGLIESTPTTDVVGMYLNDQVGSKLNYYLASTATTSAAACTPDGRQVDRVSLDLTNTVDPAAAPGLSSSISGGTHQGRGLAPGEQRLVAFVYLPQGSTLLGASIDGTPVPATGQHDTDHPVQVMWVNILPGATARLSVDVLRDAPGTRELVADVSLTIQGTTYETAPLDCSSVALP